MTASRAYAQAAEPSNFFVAGKNKIINGDFRINQRGFTSNTANDDFNFDRWFQINSGGTVTVTPQTFTPGTSPVVGYEGVTFVRQDVTGQSAANNYAALVQKIEDVRTLANQVATISFWAKSASATPSISVEFTQNFGSGGSPSSAVNTYVGKVTLSTTWTRYSITITVPSISGKTLGTTANTSWLGVRLWTSAGSDYNSRTGTLGIQTNTFDIWGVQVEAGSVATPFTTATGTLAGELAACQRYYYRVTATQAYSDFGTGYSKSTTQASILIPFPVAMRTTPTALEQTGTASNYNILHESAGSPARTACSSVPVWTGGETTTMARVDFTVSSGLTSGNGAMGGSNNNTTAYLAWSAEL